MKNKASNLSIIIVNYNSATELATCLSDIAKLPDAQYLEVIIANNDPLPLKICDYIFTITIIEINQNIGFGQANNRGLAVASRPFICFLNPDTYSFSQNIFDILDLITDHKTVVSPRILNDDDTIQEWSCGNRISLITLLINNFNLHQKPWLLQKTTQVHWISGTAFFASRQLMHKMHGFDSDFFLYFEDVDLCERIRKDGGKALLAPHITLKHTSGGSSKKTRKFQKRCYYRSQDIFFTKHFSAFHASLVRALRVFHRS